jgi:molybdopterin/thiamine biosynthesis adenylyltransferase
LGHIRIFDFDRIEEHNLTRCALYRETDVGLFKAEVAANACRRIDPNLQIESLTNDFWDGLTLQSLSEEAAVISCVDNFEARIRLNQMCLITGTDLYNAGIDSRFVSVEMYPYSTQPDCACYECILPPSVYAAVQKRYSCGWLQKIAFEEKKIPTTAITSSLAGAFLVSLFLHRLTGHSEASWGSIKFLQDSISLESTRSLIPRNEQCVRCTSIDSDARRFTASRLSSENPWPVQDPERAGEVILSEPIVTNAVCKTCQREQSYFESVRRLTDAITFCTVCQSHSVDVQFAERLTVTDFQRLFHGKRVPCKFITYRSPSYNAVVELED